MRLCRSVTRALYMTAGGQQVACRDPPSGEVLAAGVLASVGLWTRQSSAAVAGAAPRPHNASTLRCMQQNVALGTMLQIDAPDSCRIADLRNRVSSGSYSTVDMAAVGSDVQPFERLTIEPVTSSSPSQFPWRTASIVAAGAATAAAGWWFLRWQYRYVKRARRKLLLSNYRESMLVPVEHLQQIRDEFHRQLEAGLTAGGRSSLLMLPTMVDVLPTGCGAVRLH